MQAEQIISSLKAGMRVATVPQQLESVFAPPVQRYLISWMKYDPVKEIAKLDQPILVVQGTVDTQVDVADGQMLAAANSKAQLLIVDGVAHMLKDATLDADSQMATLTDPTLPLDTTVANGVVSFVQSLP